MHLTPRLGVPGTMIAARGRKSQPGQALVETGLAIALFIVVVLGTIEFGYAFMALNLIMRAETAGARAAGAPHVGSRGTCGRITDTSSVNGNPNGLVRRQIGATATAVSVSQNPDPTVLCCGACCSFTQSNIPTVAVTARANLPRLFGILGSDAFSFTRPVRFRDEGVSAGVHGRSAPAGETGCGLGLPSDPSRST